MTHVPRSAAFGLEQTCFKMFRNSSFLDLRLQGVDVTCAAFSCLRFASDVCPHVSLFQSLQDYCHMCRTQLRSVWTRCVTQQAGVGVRPPKTGVVVFVVKASAAARE